jgi:hypothetical protein
VPARSVCNKKTKQENKNKSYQCQRAVCVIKKQNKKIKINHTSAAAQEVANDGRAVIEDGFRV